MALAAIMFIAVGRSSVPSAIGEGTPVPGNPHRVINAGPKPGRYRLPARGLYVQFERRGWASEYWPGQVLQDFETLDPVVGGIVREEINLQLRTMRDMGINRITFELRSADADGDFRFPGCHIHPVLGLQWPQPTATELRNLAAFLDLVDRMGMRVWLRLVNTHMDEVPRTKSALWLSSILNVIKDQQALDLVLFEGNTRQVDTNGDGVGDACGIPAEPPLWLGPSAAPAQYVRWAIAYARSLGIPARILSAQAIVGDFFVDSEPPNRFATDGHLWSPIVTLKRIFDSLGIPNAQRTYALSLYEHKKCSTAQDLPCTEIGPHAWADETLRRVLDVVGRRSGARVVVPEMGVLPPVESGWRTEGALESLISLMEKHGIQGGAFWRWVSFSDDEDGDATLADPVKRRGVEFVYNRVEREILDLGGFHVTQIPNGSFENDTDGNRIPDRWQIVGTGQGSRVLLAAPIVPSRGRAILRLSTGSSTRGAIQAVSAAIPVSSGSSYTTVVNLKFTWTGDPIPNGEPSSRPNVSLAVRYFDSTGAPVTARPHDVFFFHQEDGTEGFQTFVFKYQTPVASFVRLAIGAERKGLPMPIVLDVDNCR